MGWQLCGSVVGVVGCVLLGPLLFFSCPTSPTSLSVHVFVLHQHNHDDILQDAAAGATVASQSGTEVDKV